MPQAVVRLQARSGAVRGPERESSGGHLKLGRAALAAWLAAASLVALAPPSVSVAAEDAELLASDAEAGDQLGAAVSVSTATASTVAVIGAPLEDGTSMDNAGVVYVFRSDGISWAQEQKLTALDAAAGDEFGGAVAVSGDIAVVGADLDDTGVIDSGSAYVFSYDAMTGPWGDEKKLTASVVHAQDQFGISVAVSGDTAVIGANDNDEATGGLAYLFRRTGSVWVQEEIFTASDVPSGGFPGDAFGASVSITSGTAVVGAPLHIHSAVASGSAYVFSVPEPSPALLAATALLALAALRRRSR